MLQAASEMRLRRRNALSLLNFLGLQLTKFITTNTHRHLTIPGTVAAHSLDSRDSAKGEQHHSAARSESIGVGSGEGVHS